jgi:hypothetical protein
MAFQKLQVTNVTATGTDGICSHGQSEERTSFPTLHQLTNFTELRAF